MVGSVLSRLSSVGNSQFFDELGEPIEGRGPGEGCFLWEDFPFQVMILQG